MVQVYVCVCVCGDAVLNLLQMRGRQLQPSPSMITSVVHGCSKSGQPKAGAVPGLHSSWSGVYGRLFKGRHWPLSLVGVQLLALVCVTPWQLFVMVAVCCTSLAEPCDYSRLVLRKCTVESSCTRCDSCRFY